MGQKLLYSGKVVVFGQGDCIPEKRLYSCKSGCARAKVVVFGQKWLYSGKVVFFGQKLSYSGKRALIRAKVVLFGDSGFIRARVVVFGQSG